MEEYSYPKCEVCREIYSLCTTCKAWHKQCQCESGQQNTVRMTKEEIERLYVEDHDIPKIVIEEKPFPVLVLPSHVKEVLDSIYDLKYFDENRGSVVMVDFMAIADHRIRHLLMECAEIALAYLNPVTRNFVVIGE